MSINHKDRKTELPDFSLMDMGLRFRVSLRLNKTTITLTRYNRFTVPLCHIFDKRSNNEMTHLEIAR